MIKLYRFNTKNNQWIFVDFGIPGKADEYARQGYLVIYL